MFSTTNFIIPITISSNSLKIRNKNNVITHIIREFLCTVRVDNNYVIIKQSAESNTIHLEFANRTEADIAHIMLRDALKQLADQNPNNTNTPPVDYFIKSFNSLIATTLHVDSDIPIPFQVSYIRKLWVNGLYIHNDLIIHYVFNNTLNTITWKAINEYDINPTDTVTLEYY